MSNTNDLLIEIGTEELPAKNLQALSTAFLENVRNGLIQAHLSFSDIQAFSTPRRLALSLSSLATHQPNRTVLKRGPSKQAAFDTEGQPSKAATHFAESCGVSVNELSEQQTPKGTWLVFEQTEPGLSSATLIPGIVQEALDRLPIAKRMRFGKHDEVFVRPVQWVVLLLDTTVVPAVFFGIHTGNTTYGHRFHCPDPILLQSPKAYETLLLKPGKVIANFNKRKMAIQTQIDIHCKELACEALIDENLLNEVTGLVEWPVVLVGSFDSAFLDIPREALISSMQAHQKCFAVRPLDQPNALLNKFIIVSNIESIHPASVTQGNESVMSARLADAAFYYEMDKKTTLQERTAVLKTVVFQAGLGSLWDKSQRLIQLCTLPHAQRAAMLCKADLLTYMVGEFPELQGIMGEYYALQDGEIPTVALAIKEHYLPRFASDTLPTTPEGCALAIADRVDTLMGLFGLGKTPTGDKDPFSLRRQALGLMRIVIEKQLDLNLKTLLIASLTSYGALLTRDPTKEILDFCFERLKAWYQEQGITARTFEAVLANAPTQPYDFHCRIQAIHHFQHLPEAESLAAANKRVKNILSKNNPYAALSKIPIDKTLLKEPAEQMLAMSLLEIEIKLEPLVRANQYTEALQVLATLKNPIDRFFDEVMVMADDNALKNNRIALLSHLRRLFLQIADISVL